MGRRDCEESKEGEKVVDGQLDKSATRRGCAKVQRMRVVLRVPFTVRVRLTFLHPTHLPPPYSPSQHAQHILFRGVVEGRLFLWVEPPHISPPWET
jgi:hypothetical protein